MSIAKNGAAIIGNEMVPASEVFVLRTLAALGRPATVPEIAHAMNEEMSDATLYSLLGRLSTRRGLVSREDASVVVHCTRLRRVFWSAHQVAKTFFAEEEDTNAPRIAKPKVPARTSGKPD